MYFKMYQKYENFPFYQAKSEKNNNESNFSIKVNVNPPK